MNRRILVLAGGGGLLVVALLAATLFGTAELSLGKALAIIGSAIGLPIDRNWELWEQTVILDVRLPRALVGFFVGAGLACCGAAMQALFRNPLAEPGVIGVSSGAAVGGVCAIFLGWASLSPWLLPLLAFVGALVTTWTIYVVASRRGHVEVGVLLLAGVALAALNSSLVSFLLSLSLADWRISTSILQWTLGGLDSVGWEHLKVMLPISLAGLAVIVAHAREMDLLLMGEVHAYSVGVDVAQVRRRLIIATSAVAGAAVAVAGPIGFVGLVIPHILRLLLGPAHRVLLPASLIVGGAFLVVADLVARTVIRPEEIRLGVITALVGAPFFLFLLVRGRKELVV